MKKIFLFSLLGSVVRFLYAYVYTPWNHSPDQLAWELILGEPLWSGELHYDQLIHYPHEGGTILISLLSIVIKLITDLPALAISAFLLDFASRFIQLVVVRKIAGEKVLLFFGTWTVFSLPSIIPWSSVNFGLHALSAVFPFLFLYLLYERPQRTADFVRHGMLLGLFLWFSYANIVLIMVYIAWLIVVQKNYKALLPFLLTFSGILTLHIIARRYLDAGFHLAEYGASLVRGVSFQTLKDPEQYKNLYRVWKDSLPGASLIPGLWGLSAYQLRMFWLVLSAMGLVGFLGWKKKDLIAESVWPGFAVIAVFLLLYALSPFYGPSAEENSYVYYRHLTYVLPFISLLVIIGLLSLRWRYALLGIYLFLCFSATLNMINSKPADQPLTRAAGFVLGAKLGHNPERVARLMDHERGSKTELFTGCGWGISTSLFQTEDHIPEKIGYLQELIRRFPDEQKRNVINGILFSFSDHVTPRINRETVGKVNEMLEEAYPALSVSEAER